MTQRWLFMARLLGSRRQGVSCGLWMGPKTVFCPRGICRLSPLPVGPACLCLAPEIDAHFKKKRVLSEQSSYAGFKFFILSILKLVFNEYVLHL